MSHGRWMKESRDVKRSSMMVLLGLLVLAALVFNSLGSDRVPLRCVRAPCPTTLTSSRVYVDYKTVFAVLVGGREINSVKVEVTVNALRDAGITIAVSDKQLNRQLQTWALEGKAAETTKYLFTDTALSIENRYPTATSFTVTYEVKVTASIPYGESQTVVREWQVSMTRSQAGVTGEVQPSTLQLSWSARMPQVPDTRLTGPDPAAKFHSTVSLTLRNMGANPTVVSGFIQTTNGAYVHESGLPVGASVVWSREEGDVAGLDTPWGIYILGKGESIQLVTPEGKQITVEVGFKKTGRVARFTEQTGSATYAGS